MISMNTKKCKLCFEQKPTSEFNQYAHYVTKDFCKTCELEREELKKNNARKCKKCRKIQPLNNFYLHRHECKQCTSILHESWRENNLQKISEYHKTHRKPETLEQKIKRKEYNRVYHMNKRAVWERVSKNTSRNSNIDICEKTS